MRKGDISAVAALATSDRKPKRSSTKNALIREAARLFGTHGFDGISLREIAAAAGQRNFNAVQYHFGSKRGLINAILEAQYREADRIRQEIIAARYSTTGLSNLSARELLKLIWEPAFVLSSREGNAVFCRFNLQYRLKSYAADHPLYDADQDAVPFEKLTEDDDSSGMYTVARLLRAKFPQFDDADFHKHTAAIDYMFLCSMIEQDNRHSQTGWKGLEIDFEIILDMMTAAMSAPT